MYFSSKQCSKIPPIEPNGLRAVSRYTGVAPAITRAPWQMDLWLLRSYRMISPGVNRAFNTTLLDEDVPFNTKYVLSALYTCAACC